MLLLVEKITDIKYEVVGFNNYPYGDESMNIDRLSEDQINSGILVESILTPELIPKKTIKHYINPVTKEQWYEYTDAPKTTEDLLREEIASLKVQNESLALTVDSILTEVIPSLLG